MIETYIYENLETIREIAPGTRIAFFEPDCKFYVVKEMPREAAEKTKILMEQQSDALPKLLTVRETEKGCEVVREYISGDSLRKVLQREKTLSEEKAVHLISGVLDGLAALHAAGLVHRDVNPNNIIVTTDGNAKIIDFGIMRSFMTSKSGDTTILGTPGYAAPEQFGFHQSDARTDIYAVGVLLNVMLTGKLAKEELAGGRLGRVVRKCIEIDAEKRYRSVADVRTAIGGFMEMPAIKGRYTKLDRVIHAIPGLRSDKWWVVVLAIIWYSAVIFVMGAFFIEETNPTLKFWVTGILSELMLFILPYFCFFNFLGVWDWIPFTRGASRKNQRIIYTLIGIALIAFGFYLVPIEGW